MIKKNIYLTGFMGTGKSTVGRLLSVRLGIPFVDTDMAIELKMGMTIEKVFAKKGGEDLFRDEERHLLQRLNRQAPLVVACGGGMVLSILNREILRQGIWINLVAQPATIMERIGQDMSRPLLGKKVKRSDVEDLLSKRKPYYNLAPHQVETDGLSPEGVLTPVLKVVLNQILVHRS